MEAVSGSSMLVVIGGERDLLALMQSLYLQNIKPVI